MKKQLTAILTSALLLCSLTACKDSAGGGQGDNSSQNDVSQCSSDLSNSSADNSSSENSSDKINGSAFDKDTLYVYGEVEIPTLSSSDVIDSKDKTIGQMLIETQTVGDYTLKLIGKNVYHGDELSDDCFYALELDVQVEKDGKLLKTEDDDNHYQHGLIGPAAPLEVFKVYSSRIGTYLDLYELEKPVIAMRYYMDESDLLVKEAVSFGIIIDDVTYFGFNTMADAQTCVTMPYDESRKQNNVPNPEDNWIGWWSLCSQDKFTTEDNHTLVDNELGIKYVFDMETALEVKTPEVNKNVGFITQPYTARILWETVKG